MPIREFRCVSCGYEFESLVLSRSDAKAQKCPKCSGKKLDSLFSVFGVSGTDRKVSTGKSCSTCGTHHCSSCN